LRAAQLTLTPHVNITCAITTKWSIAIGNYLCIFNAVHNDSLTKRRWGEILTMTSSIDAQRAPSRISDDDLREVTDIGDQVDETRALLRAAFTVAESFDVHDGGLLAIISAVQERVDAIGNALAAFSSQRAQPIAA
jgi:hypothetical protein